MKAAIVGIEAQTVGAAEVAMFRTYPPAGIILFRRNIAEPLQLAALTASLRRVLPRWSVLMVDLVGGRFA